MFNGNAGKATRLRASTQPDALSPYRHSPMGYVVPSRVAAAGTPPSARLDADPHSMDIRARRHGQRIHA
jgi:hypothetical protein